MNPSISILLPTYNGARTLARAIESVRTQTHTAWELLVIDDGSTDASAAIVATYCTQDARIRYIQNEKNLGIQKTLNRGIREAVGEYIARIDDDDFWIDPEKLASQYAHMIYDTTCVLVGTGTVVFDEKGTELFRYLLPKTDMAIRKSLLFKNCFVHSSVLFSKRVAQAVGGYGESLATRHVEDYDLWLRLGTHGTFFNIPAYATGFTFRASSLSSKNKLWQFRKNLALIYDYRKMYPGYMRALFLGSIRFVAYTCAAVVPGRIRQSFMGWYKKNW